MYTNIRPGKMGSLRPRSSHGLLKRSVNFEMSFGCFQFLPNNEQKQVDLRYHSSKVEFFRSFFGRIEDTRVLLKLTDL